MNGFHLKINNGTCTVMYKLRFITSCVTLETEINAKMAANTASTLNDLFRSNLTASDQSKLSQVIEEYFCFDSDDDESMNDGKFIH